MNNYKIQKGKRSFFTEEAITIMLSKYENKETISQIASFFDTSFNSVKGLLNRRGVYIQKFPNTTKQIEERIINLYQSGLSSHKISKTESVSKTTVLDILKRNNIERRQNIDGSLQRKYTLDSDYFNEIDTANKAYVLGFLVADGYNNEKDGAINLTIHEKDLEVLEFMNSEFKTNKPIYNVTGKPHKRITVNSRKMSKALASHGCGQAKTFITSFPNIKEYLYSDFIRGYFDGDGYIGGKANNAFELVGTIELLSEIQDILIFNCELNKTKFHQRHKERDNNIRRLTYGGTNQLKRIYNYLYNNDNFSLDRKKAKFIERITINN